MNALRNPPRSVNYVDGYLNGTGWSRKATLWERVKFHLGVLKMADRP